MFFRARPPSISDDGMRPAFVVGGNGKGLMLLVFRDPAADAGLMSQGNAVIVHNVKHDTGSLYEFLFADEYDGTLPVV